MPDVSSLTLGRSGMNSSYSQSRHGIFMQGMGTLNLTCRLLQQVSETDKPFEASWDLHDEIPKRSYGERL